MKRKILIITKSKAAAVALQCAMGKDFAVNKTSNYEYSYKLLKEEIHLIIIEYSSAKEDILSYVQQLQNSYPEIPVIVATKKNLSDELLKAIVKSENVAGFIDALVFDEETVANEILKVLKMAKRQ